jgi:serine/threonine-protein kinase
MNADPLIGRSIDGRYRIDAVVGKGGMGTVYRATRLLIGDEVAIKILHIGEVEDPQAAERFRREARAAARLKHPNAVSIYDFGVSSDGLQYLVMDLVEGRSLRDITKEQGPISLSLVAEIVSQICAALDEAHRHHIVHRDIKPDNIILNSTPAGVRVKVLDFGIAKLRDDSATNLTQTGNVMGTPHYMSPEQCLGEELDSRADIYSLAIVIYEMLCGRVPFNSPVSTAVVIQHVNQTPPSLRSFNPAISEEVESVVFRGLEKARDMRPETAGAFARQLIEAINPEAGPAFAYSDRSLRLSPRSQEEPDEETIEKRPDAHAGPVLPETVYLARPGMSDHGASRPTNGSQSALTSKVKHTRAFPYRSLVAIAAVVLAGFMAYLWFQQDKTVTGGPSGPSSVPSPAATMAMAGGPAVNTNSGSAPKPTHAGMVQIGSGQLQMGSNEGDTDAQPAHMVMVKSFYLDIYEVTCRDYKNFIDEKKREPPPTWKDGNYPPGTDLHPVTGVTWEDATAYAQWAGKRLPTEEEWEFAARGPQGLRYPWGNQWRSGCANVDKVRNGVTNVGSYNCSSPFGVQDLIGNAWEWTDSSWAPYPGGQFANPPHPSDKVIRGGSWESPRSFISSTSRGGHKGVGVQTGFRCAMDGP